MHLISACIARFRDIGGLAHLPTCIGTAAANSISSIVYERRFVQSRLTVLREVSHRQRRVWFDGLILAYTLRFTGSEMVHQSESLNYSQVQAGT